jgi:hypothetical protein
MPRLSVGTTTHRRPDDERVFADDQGRLWTAAHTGEAIVFTCISDGRQSGRAIAVDVVRLDNSVGDDILRAWLAAAPRIGTLP